MSPPSPAPSQPALEHRIYPFHLEKRQMEEGWSLLQHKKSSLCLCETSSWSAGAGRFSLVKESFTVFQQRAQGK